MADAPLILEAVPEAPRRSLNGHKGTFGTVIVIGGCATMPGAPALTARAALRSGAGLVKLATDARTLGVSLGFCASVTGLVLEGGADEMAAAIERADPPQRAVLAVGPGWGVVSERHDARAELLRRLLAGPRRVVLDADGLNVLAKNEGLGQCRRTGDATGVDCVMTPHPGEFRRLVASLPAAWAVAEDPTRALDRPRAAAGLARAFRSVVVLKGSATVVSDADGTRVYRNSSGNPALATGGTGDVLTGLIAGLMAQGMSGFDAACLGVWAHGHAADGWAKEHGVAGMLAEVLADRLPGSLGSCRAADACL